MNSHSQPRVTAVTDFPDATRHNQLMVATHDTRRAGELFQAHHDKIYRYVLRMVKNPAEAEDLTQDTFLRAFRGQEALRDPQAVRGWLYRIATHACLDRLRQRTPPLSLDGLPAAERVAAAVSGDPSALEVAERKETSLCVQRCLDFLPDNYRAVILLYEAHSLTAAEIASLLGLKLTTVKMRLHRAHRMLQQVMECGCATSTNEQGVPVCQPKAGVK
jgi:RNA polymerase sigma-70 factor, ECF subfamily